MYVFKCRRHGERTEEQVYRSNDKSSMHGFRYKCKECTYLATGKRPCKIHGDISPEERLKCGSCKLCALSFMRNSNEKRDKNRDAFNEKAKLKRDANPELYKIKYKEQYKREVQRHGKEKINDISIATKRGLTYEQYMQMFKDQQDRCAICNSVETRVFTDRFTKEIRLAKLCLDHCHKTNKVRGLLCHDCNTALGKFKDDTIIMQNAINYLKRYE